MLGDMSTPTKLAKRTDFPADGRLSPTGRVWRHCPESNRWWLWWYNEWRLLPKVGRDQQSWNDYVRFIENHGLT